MDARLLAKLIAVARVAIGVAVFLAPRATGRRWIGDAADDRAARLAIRGLAGRDLALGVGTLLAMRHGAPARGWVEAGTLADASDAIGTLASWGDLPRLSRGVTLVTAGGAAILGPIVARQVDQR